MSYTGLPFHPGIYVKDVRVFNARWADINDKIRDLLMNSRTDSTDIDNFLHEMDRIIRFFEVALEPDPPFTIDEFVNIVVLDMALARRQSAFPTSMEIELQDRGIDLKEEWWMQDDFVRTMARHIKALLVEKHLDETETK